MMPGIFQKVILAPCHPDFPTFSIIGYINDSFLSGNGTTNGDSTIQLLNINLTSQLMIHISASFWLGLIVSVPALIAIIWRFISPALYPEEKKSGSAALIGGAVMFYIGIVTAYYIVFPITLRFLAGYQLSPAIPNMISLDSYMDTFTGLCLVMGLTFELPLLTWFMGRLGLIDRSFFSCYRRHAIVALLIVAALITPTGDPLTLAVVFLPLYILWEISALMIRPPKAPLKH